MTIDSGILIVAGIGGATVLIGAAEYIVHRVLGNDQILNGAIDDFDSSMEATRLRCSREESIDDASRVHSSTTKQP
jgi:hypothetical protein